MGHRQRRGAFAATAAPTATGRAEAIGIDEFIAKEVERYSQVLEAVLLGRKQDLAFFRLDDAVAKAGILVRHEESRFNLVKSQHDAFPNLPPVRASFDLSASQGGRSARRIQGGCSWGKLR